jgi:hypothetical protein
MRNSGESTEMKGIILNKLIAICKVKCLENLHYA